jgi:NitT/TauT family transport system permease protein
MQAAVRAPLAARRRPALGAGAIRALVVLALLVVWEIYARFFADSALIAPPSAVAGALAPAVFANPAVRGAVLLTLVELVVAFGLAVVVGTVVGFLIGATAFGRRSFGPIVLLLYAVPQVVVLPLFVLLFGIGPPAKIAFGFTHGIFPIIVNTMAGMRDVNPILVAGARTMGASRAQILRHVIFPNMIGTVFTGLRLAMTMTLLGVILAELFVSTNGVGFFTQQYAETFKPASLFALVGTLALMAVAANELVRLIESRLTRWKG